MEATLGEIFADVGALDVSQSDKLLRKVNDEARSVKVKHE